MASARCLAPLTFRQLVGEFTGDALAIFPKAKLLTSPAGAPCVFQSPQNYALVGGQVSSSLTVFGSQKGGVLLVIGQTQQFLTISETTNCPIIQLTQPNSIAGAPGLAIPTSKVTPFSCGQYGISIKTGETVSLYGFLDDTAGNEIAVTCSLWLIPVV